MLKKRRWRVAKRNIRHWPRTNMDYCIYLVKIIYDSSEIRWRLPLIIGTFSNLSCLESLIHQSIPPPSLGYLRFLCPVYVAFSDEFVATVFSYIRKIRNYQFYVIHTRILRRPHTLERFQKACHRERGNRVQSKMKEYRSLSYTLYTR